MLIKCKNCKHEWESKSKLGIVICGSCGQKIKTKYFVKLKKDKK